MQDGAVNAGLLALELDAFAHLLESALAGDVFKHGEGEGQRLTHGAGGDDVAIFDNGLLARKGAGGEVDVKAGEAGGSAALKQAELGLDRGSGADGGDVLGSGELADHVADAFVAAQMGGAGHAAG